MSVVIRTPFAAKTVGSKLTVKSTGLPGWLGSTPAHTVCNVSATSSSSIRVTKPLPQVSRTVTPVAWTGVSKPTVIDAGDPFCWAGAHAVGMSP